jgi:HK97 family phage portal protein
VAAPLLQRFFPRGYSPVPSTNGNGKHADPAESKGLTITGPNVVAADFWPLSAAGATTLDLGILPVSGLGWYRAAWLIYACMSYRAEKISQAPLWITEETDGEESWIKGDHSLAGILKRPNPDMRMRAFLALTSLFLDGTGRCCWVKVRDRGERTAALRPFSANDVLETRSKDGRFFGEFKIRTAERPGGEWFAAADVIHLYNEDPDDPRGVVAPLDVAAEAAGIGRQLAESIRAGLRNSIVPGFVVTIPADTSPDQKAELRASYRAEYEAARNQGKTLVLSGGATGARQKLGFAGLEGGSLAKEQEIAVCACFRTPPVIIGALVGVENSSDRHNLETSRDLFYENAVEPIWTRIEEAFTDDLLAEVDSNPLRFVRFVKTGIRAYQEDITTKAEAIAELREELDLDERRAVLGYPAASAEQRAEIGATGGDAAAGESEAPKALTLPERKNADTLRWAVHEAFLQGQELGWELEAASLLAEDRDAVLRLASETLRASRKDDDIGAPAEPGSVRELLRAIAKHLDVDAPARWLARISPLTSATSRRAVERLAAELGVAFDLLQPGLLKFVEEHAAELVTQVTGTTKEALRAALAEGLVEGESIPALAARIREAAAFNRDRATLIARTETVASTNGAQLRAVTGWVAGASSRVTKRWLSAGDARVRPAHRALNGEKRSIDEAFSNGLQHPGEPNCRCTLVYEMEEAA